MALSQRVRGSLRPRAGWRECAWSIACLGGLAGAAAPMAMPAPESVLVAPDGSVPPGWAAEFSGAGAKASVKTHAAWAAFALPEKQTIDPSVNAAGFVADYSGVLRIEEPGRYRFGIEAQGGTAQISVFKSDGTRLATAANPAAARANTVFTPFVQLAAGEITVNVRYTRKGDGAARLRTLWEMERVNDTGFRAEPIPAWSVAVPKFATKDAAAGLAARHGRALLGELNCVSCHALPAKAEAAVEVVKSPLLGEIGRRANPAWLLQWVTQPHDVKPGTFMPDVIGESAQDRADADAIVHFLVAPRYDPDSASQPVANERTVLSEGRRLYHSVGCVACHGPLESQAAAFNDAELPSDMPTAHVPAPLGKLAGKWRVGPLSEFLVDPLRVHPGGRMPSMSLSNEESDLLSAYLVTALAGGKLEPEPPFAVDPAKVERGRAAFAARGCAACHEVGHGLPAVDTTLKAPALASAKLGKGCLDPTDTKSPRFELNDAERAALTAGIQSLSTCTGEPAPIDAMERAIDSLSCLSCHSKDGVGGPDKAIGGYFRTLTNADLGDEGSHPPHLTGVGSKLNTNWLSQVLLAGGRGRPYMATRMPQFGAGAVGTLAHRLAAQAGVWPDTDTQEPKPSDVIVAAGQKLVGEKGLNCISCHVFGESPPAGTPGPNIADFAGRIRYEWWKDYIMAPPRFKPGTRMPAFYATGKGAVTDIFNGDPDKQADAMWAYFTLGEFAPAPEGVPDSKGFALRVADRPLVFRTFLKDAGSRGIAVGFPGNGPHFAFDAATCRLVSAWHGAFLDASGAWAGRGGQVTDGQGDGDWKGECVTIVPKPDSTEEAWAPFATIVVSRFGGYTLDKAGVPTFRYTVQGTNRESKPAGTVLQVEDRFEPDAKADVLFKRSFIVRGMEGKKTPSFYIVLPGDYPVEGAAKIKAVKLVDIKNATTTRSAIPDGATTIAVTPAEVGDVVFVVEVAK